jgi:hypothetical protein
MEYKLYDLNGERIPKTYAERDVISYAQSRFNKQQNKAMDSVMPESSPPAKRVEANY